MIKYADLICTLILFLSYYMVFLMQDVTEEAAHDSLELQDAVNFTIEQETATGLLQV